MSNIWNGTFLWIWESWKIHNGNVDAMIQQAKDLGLTGVIIKYSDGNLVGDPLSQRFMQQFKSLAPAFKQAGFVVGGWTYQYFTDIDGEVDALRQAVEAGADFIVLDAEKHVIGKAAEISLYGTTVRALYPNLQIGLSSYAYADLHPEIPFDAYNTFVDVMMPQVYWATINNSVEVVYHHSMQSFQKYGKPVIPTGQAYSDLDQGVNCTSADMARFVALCKANGIEHVAWWDWQHANADHFTAIQSNIISKEVENVPCQVPDWAKPTIDKLVAKKVLHDTSGDETFYRVLVVLDRLGKLD